MFHESSSKLARVNVAYQMRVKLQVGCDYRKPCSPPNWDNRTCENVIAQKQEKQLGTCAVLADVKCAHK